MANAMSLEDRVQRLEDEKQIRELLVEYGRRLDAHDFHGYAQLFAKDGEWIGGLGRARGPGAIEAMLTRAIGAAAPNPSRAASFHVLSNFQIDVEGDRATAYSRLLYFVRSPEDAPNPSRGGHYEDELIREEGAWKFLRRVVMGEIPFQDPLGTLRTEAT